MSIFNRVFGEPVPSLSVLKLQKKLKDGKQPFLPDVCQPEEFRLGHIAGASLIPLGELSRRMKEVPMDREIICICASGHRSVPAVQKLKAAGHTASSMRNGMIAWQMARLPVKKGM
jgi:rhodanese-related sulfurtransferase